MTDQIRNATVVGAGVMGSGIAQVLALHGYDVSLHDLSEERLHDALHGIEHHRFGLRRAAERGKITAADVDAALQRLTPTTDLASACASADIVVEAVFEDLAVKLGVFADLDRLCPPPTILTSNTGGFSITALAVATQRPERVLGWHWSQPCSVMALAEIAVTDRTADEATAAVCAMAQQCGKNPVVIRDQPLTWGFVTNRLLRVLKEEAERIVGEGIATEEQVDVLMEDAFRWPMGPFGSSPRGRSVGLQGLGAQDLVKLDAQQARRRVTEGA